ncbi:phage portal protein [Rhodococcus opacus]|uniref:Phage capsid protein n=1 Tax=Rhodococcus opacus TaxID=37919 RepID=A0A2S8JAY6_RHOOP|nr:phage portal protein [Rhodococcus opacus]PQP24155.1 phage capsid protein [Rhodococcus opacus]
MEQPIVPSDFTSRRTSPNLPTTTLSERESAIANTLSMQLSSARPGFYLSDLYYRGMQKMTDLGISIPPELKGLTEVLGWAQIGVEARDERLTVQGFRLPSSTTASEDIWDLWQANNLDEESGLAHLDSLVFGSAYVVVGPGESPGDQPVITVESPLHMTANWNSRKRATTAAFQSYRDDDFTSETYGHQLAVLYLPGSTIHMVQGSKGWVVIDRDDYDNLDGIPVVLMANRASSLQRMGTSDIRESWRNTMDRAARTMLGMEVAREFFAAPQRYILGASEAAFQNSDGDLKTAWETYTGHVLVLEPNEDTERNPEVGTFQTGDPANFTTLLADDRATMAALTGLPPHFFGIYADGNPASADAIRMSDFRLKTIADKITVARGGNWENVVRIALQIRDGKLPADAHRLETDWASTGIPTPNADTDAMQKQVAAGIIPPESDVVLKRLGYSGVERIQIANERKRARGQANLDALVNRTTPTTPTPDEGTPTAAVPDGE